jgi:hypothetical protein
MTEGAETPNLTEMLGARNFDGTSRSEVFAGREETLKNVVARGSVRTGS